MTLIWPGRQVAVNLNVSNSTITGLCDFYCLFRRGKDCFSRHFILLIKTVTQFQDVCIPPPRHFILLFKTVTQFQDVCIPPPRHFILLIKTVTQFQDVCIPPPRPPPESADMSLLSITTVQVWRSVHHHCVQVWRSVHHHCVQVWRSVHHHCVQVWRSVHHHCVQVWRSVHHHCVQVWRSVLAVQGHSRGRQRETMGTMGTTDVTYVTRDKTAGTSKKGVVYDQTLLRILVLVPTQH